MRFDLKKRGKLFALAEDTSPKSLRSFWHALLTGRKPTVNVHLLVEGRGTPGALRYQADRDARLGLCCVGQAAVPPHSTALGAFPPIFHRSWSLFCLYLTPLGLRQHETRSPSPWQFSLRDRGTALPSAINHKIESPSPVLFTEHQIPWLGWFRGLLESHLWAQIP